MARHWSNEIVHRRGNRYRKWTWDFDRSTHALVLNGYEEWLDNQGEKQLQAIYERVYEVDARGVYRRAESIDRAAVPLPESVTRKVLASFKVSIKVVS